MDYDIDYDKDCECYVWWYDGAGMCLAAETMAEAVAEVTHLAAMGQYPEASILPEGEEEVEYCYDDIMDGDMDSALASAGWGMDEDYGHFGGDDH